MKRSTLLLFVATTGLFSCEQGSKSTPSTGGNSTKNVRSHILPAYTKYEYTDSIGSSLIIENGGPRGMKYTAPNGDVYAYALFWSQISNGTDRAMKVKVSFPVDAYEVPSLPGEYFKILVPPDTMTVANESLFNFGLMDLNGFLDNNMGKKTSLERTVGSKGSTGFYVVMLRPIDRTRGALRAGLSLKGQSLFYKISQYTPTKALSLMKEQEIQVGSIDLKNLKLRE